MAKTVNNKIKTIPQIDIIARMYPNMLEISSIILPSLLQPRSPANEFARMNTRRYSPIFIKGGKIINIRTTIKITPIFERRYSILAPAVLKESPILLPINGII